MVELMFGVDSWSRGLLGGLMTGWRWTVRREMAAGLVAGDELSNEEIARRVGVTRQGLDRWKRHPAFRERVAELLAAAREAVRAKGIADKENRVGALDERWKLLLEVVRARAAEYGAVDPPVPGASWRAAGDRGAVAGVSRGP